MGLGAEDTSEAKLFATPGDTAPREKNLALQNAITVGKLATLSGQLVDADPADLHSLRVDGGDLQAETIEADFVPSPDSD